MLLMQIRDVGDKGRAFPWPGIGRRGLGRPWHRFRPRGDKKGLHSPAPGAFLGGKGPRLQKVFFFTLSPRGAPVPRPLALSSGLGSRDIEVSDAFAFRPLCPRRAARSPCVCPCGVGKYDSQARAHDRAEHVKVFKKCANLIFDFLGAPECPALGRKTGRPEDAKGGKMQE